MTQPVPWGPALKTAPLGHLRRAINRSTRPPERPRWRWPNLWQRRLRGGRCLKSRRFTVCLATTGSTIRTLLHGKINPKDWQVLSLGDAGFLLFFRVVSGDYGKPWTRLLYVLLWVDEVVNIWAHVRTVRLALGLIWCENIVVSSLERIELGLSITVSFISIVVTSTTTSLFWWALLA